MKIKDLDESFRDELYVGDFVSEKVEGGYKLKIVECIIDNKKIVYKDLGKYLDVELLDGDDELNWMDGLFFVEKRG